ncbi:AAA family ATPase [Methanobrevibacter sp.]|uniref:AAA family ATPase n=1 Tax=Methanobrevibacter sp. TaxID=66852 RepID=UPI0025E9945C|nr:AAA family ATPase [Methanobrevibacter sp.]
MARGLGKGLDSLIPEFYDEDFDSNGALSLEDMLKEDENSDSEESIDKVSEDDESNVNDIEESGEDDSVVDESNVNDVDSDDGQEDEEEYKPEETSNEEITEENDENIDSSENISSTEDGQDSLSNPQEIKRQENVAEVLDIVDKNPRITLWSSRSAAVFRYLRKTEPEFSISREASILIDEAVSKKYPEIWDLFEDLK